METQLEMLESEALKLAPNERAALAQRLLASLEEDSEIEEAWTCEIERRIAESRVAQSRLSQLLGHWLRYVPS